MLVTIQSTPAPELVVEEGSAAWGWGSLPHQLCGACVQRAADVFQGQFDGCGSRRTGCSSEHVATIGSGAVRAASRQTVTLRPWGSR